VLPEVPAIAETVKDYEVVNWWGFVAPAGTPDDIVQRLQAETRKAVNLPDVREHMRAQAAEPQGSSAAEFGAMLRAAVAKWTKVIREIDLRVD
jgi:tripartite-type tricarboxylate transporter receptor subunit TctC